ncbi:hypothetical protein PIB30_025888 [Stylosanthes scabra]|uniref:Uncharacterized protein n=1 Tax=Stylosanthes scabra TaxID=79078 RepID=A0ABU6YC33_9FABA|nr:hypothetical protein [Stylosanthes scabra]
MTKKKSCQNVHDPRVLSEAERELYGWVDENIFSQRFVIAVDMLPSLRGDMSLTEGRISEEDYILEAVGPSDRLPLRARENRAHFLWAQSGGEEPKGSQKEQEKQGDWTKAKEPNQPQTARPRPPFLMRKFSVGGAPARPRWRVHATPFLNDEDSIGGALAR